ncbi:MAG TPA: hypothetical protein VIV60_28925 [Polyangiaceae bacterium]
MRIEDLSIITLIAGILGVSIAGCSDSEGIPAGVGGATGGAANSGGAATGGSSAAATGGSKPTAAGGTSSTSSASATGGTGSGGAPSTGGTQAAVGGTGTGGKSSIANNGGTTSKASGGTTSTGGAAPVGGEKSTTEGGAAGRGTGGTSPLGVGGTTGGRNTVATGGQLATAGSGATATGGSSNTGPCTASASKSVSSLKGTGPHKVVMESNSDIACGTIYRPEDLGGTEKYPIFVWGEGACSRDGKSNQASMAEIASHGYFVVADGPPSGGNCPSLSMPSTSADLANLSKTLLGYVTWAIAENGKACSAYAGSIDTTKVAADGFSCGGLMAESTAGDPRLTALGITSSGLTNENKDFYKTIHTPVKILLGGSGDVAYGNGERDYTNISALGIPIILLSKDGAGHGGDLGNGTGSFNSVNLAWINWQLKGDTTATGKGALFGSTCKYCNGGGWEYKSANIQ